MWTDSRRFILLITGVGFALRLLLLDRFPFREDEAIYSYWALHGWLQDPFFLSVWPDKPPLFLWLLGATFRAFGTEPASARWLNIAASTLTIPVTAVSARRLWGDHAAMVAALVLALSPFAISFAPTAYVDPVLVLFGSLALCLAILMRPFAAGLFLGAAIMTKQQGVLYAPLLLMVLIAGVRPVSIRSCLRQSLYVIFGLVLVLIPIIWWDSLRWAVAPSPWDLSVRNYAAIAVLPPTQWLDRLQQWLPLLWHLTASDVVWLSLLLAASVAILRGRELPRTSNLLAWVLAAWFMGFLLLHVATSVQVWDRYLLPLAPVLALLCGWLTGLSFQRASVLTRRMTVAAMTVILIVPAWQAATGLLITGGDHGAYAGLEEAIAWVDDEIDNSEIERAVIYHDTLGWHYQYYLFKQIQNGKADLRWFPSSTYLADNAEKTPHLRKFYVQPNWAAQPDLAERLGMRGLSLTSVAVRGRFSVYEVSGAGPEACDWCLCDGKPDIGWQILAVDGQKTVLSSAADSSPQAAIVKAWQQP